MNTDHAVSCLGIYKKFCADLKTSVKYGLADCLRFVSGYLPPTDLRKNEFWALQDINFNLTKGECLGIMGVNGSGKSTLLRLLYGVYPPDAGQIEISRRIGALIAVGAGFSPSLSGRANIFINGALLGLSRREINERIDDIISFANLESDIDKPVQHYSTGMFVRLGFSISAMCRPNVLLIDEALAVGDLNFQKKCFDYLFELKNQGTAIILVSHSPGDVWSIADKGLLLNRGRQEYFGTVEETIRRYDENNALMYKQELVRNHYSLQVNEGYSKGTGDAVITDVRTYDVQGNPRNEFEFKEPFIIESVFQVFNRIEKPILRFTLDATHYKFIAALDSVEQNQHYESISPGCYICRTLIKAQNFNPGTYIINANICKKTFGAHLFLWKNACSFQIKHPRDRFLYADPNSIMFLDSEFEIQPISDKRGSEQQPVIVQEIDSPRPEITQS